jgi:hypothetical protein
VSAFPRQFSPYYRSVNRTRILYQGEEALKLGATAQEMPECTGFAVSLGGTRGAGESARLIGFLQEREIIQANSVLTFGGSHKKRRCRTRS